MSGSLTRSMRAMRLASNAIRQSRAASTDPSSSSSSPSIPPSSSPSSTASSSKLPPLLPHFPVPRRPGFQSLHPGSVHKHINFPYRVFEAPPKDSIPETVGGNESLMKERILAASTGLTAQEIKGLRRYTVRIGRVTQMTKKGKMPSFTALVVVGSPTKGMVGIGWGRGATNLKAMDQGFSKAVQSMDYVTRYEGRTVWGTGQDLENKWGSTKIIMRARPSGFGLMVPPALHRVFTACGIRDISATIEGSRNPVEVVKCAIQLLHGGANPPGFGSGLSGRGRREDKGAGIRSREEIERQRGRYGIDIGRRV